MDILQAVFLGLIQGITEWLPISSSGHLALVQNYLGMKVPVEFDVFLHLGTLLAVCVFYKEKIGLMLSSVLRFDYKSEPGKEAAYIVLASIPTAIIGFGFKDQFEAMFASSLIIGICLLLTGEILFIASMIKNGKKGLSARSSLVIGLAQGLAIAPGISRSGMTISAGLLQNIDAKKAAGFSFMLSIPAIIGASFFQIKDSGLDLASETFLPYIIGAAVAALVGYISIKFLLRVLEERRFKLFAYYCWLIGFVVILIEVL